jgi:hypothetical protein
LLLRGMIDRQEVERMAVELAVGLAKMAYRQG